MKRYRDIRVSEGHPRGCWKDEEGTAAARRSEEDFCWRRHQWRSAPNGAEEERGMAGPGTASIQRPPDRWEALVLFGSCPRG